MFVHLWLKVTGGNKGIGFAIVKGLCKNLQGYDVLLTGMLGNWAQDVQWTWNKSCVSVHSTKNYIECY